MKKSRFGEERIIAVLKEHQAGIAVAEICRKHGIGDAIFDHWRNRFGGMGVSDARRLKVLDDENRKLKKLLAEAMLDVATLREALGKKLPTLVRVLRWQEQRGVAWHHIAPGKPIQNAFVESPNGASGTSA